MSYKSLNLCWYRRIILTLALLASPGCTGISNDNGQVPGSIWEKRLTDIRIGMDRVALEGLLAKIPDYLPGFQPWIGGNTAVYVLDDSWEVQVQYTANDKVQNFTLTERGGLPQLRERIPPDLYADVRLIHACPRADLGGARERFDPIILIRAVNRLHAAGKERALQVLTYYSELATSDYELSLEHRLHEDRVFLILRLLFVPKDENQRMPTLQLGRGDVVLPQGNTSWPLFPLALVDNTPFILVSGHVVGGESAGAKVAIDHCRTQCELRKRPLRPVESPVVAAQRLVESREWKELFQFRENSPNEKEAKAFVRWQGLRALAFSGLVCKVDKESLYLDQEWTKESRRIGEFKPYWNPDKQLFMIGRNKP